VLLACSSFLSTFARKLYQHPREARVARWVKDLGDKTFRLDYDLNENSLVFDLGGYEGQWASDIFSRYRCNIHIFEPVAAFAKGIEQRFARNPKVYVHPFGLAAETREAIISVKKDGSSICREGKEREAVKLVKAADFFAENKIECIDLMKINIEGGEYDLLEHLLDAGWVGHIRNIQVQFHDWVPGAERRAVAIQEQLKGTHKITYQYSFVWENWQIPAE
jgi:FkbM family methyltransferase